MRYSNLTLGVNVDHAATLRQSRKTKYPDPVHIALQAEQAGADSITIHLREDRRHIQDDDVMILRSLMQTKMNLEIAVETEMISFAAEVKPEYVCLVPEKRKELTTEGGLDVITNIDKITKACSKLSKSDIKISLFIDPTKEQIDAALTTGAYAIELHTGEYANTVDKEQKKQLARLIKAAEYASSKGIKVNAGHGLNYQNVKPIAAINTITELNIGHAIIAKALFVGIQQATIDMIQLMQQSRSVSNL